MLPEGLAFARTAPIQSLQAVPAQSELRLGTYERVAADGESYT